ncbi:MAG: hypothetical protein ACERKO_00655 [Acetanaerobacterium sp.]
MMLAFPLIFLLIALFEVPQLIRKKLWRELVVFSLLFVPALTVSVFYGAGVHIPSPIMGIKHLIEDVLRISFH